MKADDRVWYNVCQLYIASVCIGIGVILTLPSDTFHTSRSYVLLSQYPLTEDQWGMVWTALGVACFLSAYFTKQILLRNGDDQFGSLMIKRMYRVFRITWFLVTPLMIFWAWSFIVSNAATVGVVFFLCTAAMSQWVFHRVTREARRHG